MNMQFDGIRATDGDYDIEDPTTRGDIALSRNRMWSHRFRGKWNLSLGNIPSRDKMPIDVLTEKVVCVMGIVFSNERSIASMFCLHVGSVIVMQTK